MYIDPVFHVSLLELAADNPHIRQVQIPEPLVVVNEENEYEMKEILNSRTRWRRLE